MIKDTFKLINQPIQVIRDRLYFDTWEYCCTFNMHEAGSLRGLSHRDLASRIEWITSSRWANKRPVTPEDINDLYAMCDFLLTNKHAFKLYVESNTLRVYTNDVDLIESIEHRSEPKNIRVTQALAINERDVVLLKNPVHVYRTQLRSINLTTEQRIAVKSMIDNSHGQIRSSPGLDVYLKYVKPQSPSFPSIGHAWIRGRNLTATPFIDHNDRKWETMISLVVPGFVSKTVPIRQRTK